LSAQPLPQSWVERHPVGRFVAGGVVIGWAVLLAVYVSGIWALDVTFFVAVAVLTCALGILSTLAAITAYRKSDRDPTPKLFAAPGISWVRDVKDYFRWLTPLAFAFGIIFAHYFWH
jgi:predicted outer membrane lipoprotein